MEPTRLMSEGATEFERWVLETARSERPSPELDQRMLSVLTTAAVGGAVLGGAATVQAATSGIGKAWLILGRLGWAKWGAGVVGISGVALTAFVLTNSEKPVAAASAPVEPRVTLQASTAAPLEIEKRAFKVETASVPQPDSTVNAPKQSQGSGTGSAMGRGVSDPLKDELALLQRARAALERKEAAAALAVLAQYDRRHPKGQLSQEATVLRVQALDARGKAAQADRLAKDFLEKNPTSAHAPQIERNRSTP